MKSKHLIFYLTSQCLLKGLTRLGYADTETYRFQMKGSYSDSPTRSTVPKTWYILPCDTNTFVVGVGVVVDVGVVRLNFYLVLVKTISCVFE